MLDRQCREVRVGRAAGDAGRLEERSEQVHVPWSRLDDAHALLVELPAHVTEGGDRRERPHEHGRVGDETNEKPSMTADARPIRLLAVDEVLPPRPRPLVTRMARSGTGLCATDEDAGATVLVATSR